MSTVVPRTPHFLVEWYRPDLEEAMFDENLARLTDCVASLTEAEGHVRLLMTLVVACDEVAFAVFSAESAELVATLCRLAGIPPQRLTPVVNARFPSPERRETPDSIEGVVR